MAAFWQSVLNALKEQLNGFFSCFFWFSKEGFALLHIYKMSLITLFLPSPQFWLAFPPTSLWEPCFPPCLLSWPACFLFPALATSVTWALSLASWLPVSLVLLSVLCPLPFLQQTPRQGTVQVFKHRSHLASNLRLLLSDRYVALTHEADFRSYLLAFSRHLFLSCILLIWPLCQYLFTKPMH